MRPAGQVPASPARAIFRRPAGCESLEKPGKSPLPGWRKSLHLADGGPAACGLLPAARGPGARGRGAVGPGFAGGDCPHQALGQETRFGQFPRVGTTGTAGVPVRRSPWSAFLSQGVPQRSDRQQLARTTSCFEADRWPWRSRPLARSGAIQRPNKEGPIQKAFGGQPVGLPFAQPRASKARGKRAAAAAGRHLKQHRGNLRPAGLRSRQPPPLPRSGGGVFLAANRKGFAVRQSGHSVAAAARPRRPAPVRKRLSHGHTWR